jgi:hypothetical protein
MVKTVFGVPIIKKKWQQVISKDNISSYNIINNIQYNIVLFNLRKKKDRYIIYASVNYKYDYDLNFKIAECNLSKIYMYLIKKITKDLFKNFRDHVHYVLFDKICSYLDIGNIICYEQIYKHLINQMLYIKN